MTSTSSSPPARPRNSVLVALDVIAGILLILVGLGVGLAVLTSAISYGGLHAGCGAGPYEGLVCNSTVLGAVVFGLIAVAVLAWFLGLGFFVVSVIRKRLAFIWPLAGVIVTIVLFYIGTWLVGLTFG